MIIAKKYINLDRSIKYILFYDNNYKIGNNKNDKIYLASLKNS